MRPCDIFINSTLTSWPSLLWPEPNIRLYSESSELLKSDFSKLWLSKTSRVWRTLPMVNPGERLQRDYRNRPYWPHNEPVWAVNSSLTCCGLLTLIERPPELHRLASLLHLLLDFSQLCADLRRRTRWENMILTPKMKINVWENHHNRRI